MNIAAPFIRRPVMTTLVMTGLLWFGLMAYQRLPVSDLPNVDFPTINVTAALPGASPETMASSVATPLEKEFTTIDGLDSMTSSSALGSTSITLQFSLERDVDGAAQDVQAAISRVVGRLPRDMPAPPSYRKSNPADQPILFYSLTSPSLPLFRLNEYAETLLAQRLSTLSGVAQVMVYGSQKYAVRIRVDPRLLTSRGIGFDEVTRAIQGANVNLPTGAVFGPARSFTVETNGQLADAAAFREVIVSQHNGQTTRLKDVAEVADGVENDKTAAWYVDQRSVVLAIQKQPGANTVRVADAVKAAIPDLEAQIPASVKLKLIFDRSESIKESVADVTFTLWLTIGLVVLVVFAFLRNLTATLIPSLAMPMSIIATFAAMHLLGYSLDNLSLMALTLSVGFVVDDAIVVLENIVRHIEMGETPLQAALNGSREIGFTIVSMTVSLAAVFIPILFMGGILGRLFAEFSVTIAIAILISGVISLTLTPMLSALFLRGGERKHGFLYRASERFFGWMQGAYAWGLDQSLRFHLLVMVFSVGVIIATVMMFQKIPKGFLPTEDTGQPFALTEAQEGISFDNMKELQLTAARVVKADPAVEGFSSSAGARPGISGSNAGLMFIRLKPRAQRDPAPKVVDRLRPKLAAIPGLRVFLQQPPPIRIGGQFSKSQYQYTLQSPDTASLYQAAPVMVDKLRAIPGLRDVSSDLQLKNPQIDVAIDRDRAALLGLSVAQIEDALFSAFGARQVSTIYAPNNTYNVIIELDPAVQRDMTTLDLIHVRSSGGKLIPLRAAASTRDGLGPQAVNHLGQLPAVTISFNLDPGMALGQAVDRIAEIERSVLPPTVTTRFQGVAEAFQSSLGGLGFLLLMAVVVIYMVLGILYESFIHPITILSALPFAGMGALAALMWMGMDLNVYAFVGVILLVGLVKKNGIMMVDFAIEARRDRNLGPREAIREASLVRFRPIMMTTMAALMGTLPIALGHGAGAEARQPLGVAVVGGLLFSQFLTLYVTPVFYLYMEWLGEFFRRLRGRQPSGQPAAAE
ncbi:MAG: Multidrug resistance protein MdtB [Myxococcota bacterium]|nr:Multidrug resistance protein MdtB [Myxococcota bacterium]